MNRLLPRLSAAIRPARWSVALTSLGFCSAVAVTALPALGAERVYVTYGTLEVSLPIKSLEHFVDTGIVDEHWDGIAQYANRQQLEQIRLALQARAEISPVTISQFLYTAQGEVLLERLGRVIQTKARQPGFYAIRAALILAAADSEGLTLLNVLRKFPTYGIRIDISRGLAIAGQLTNILNRSNRAIAGVINLSEAQAASDPAPNFTTLPDPQRAGPFSWQQRSLSLVNETRNRTFPLDLYLPNNAPQPAPVVVISHGLGSDRISFAYLAEHLASYGFAVAVPEHPGSNAQQLQDLVSGRANEVAQPMEFIDRPLDVKDILNYLETLSNTDPAYRGRLDLQRVGVIGQSFGGYTALVLAGADINFSQLDQDCQLENETWNLSLLLQCRARTLSDEYSLNDARVKAVIAINPITSSILGEANLRSIKIPVMMISGSADTVAPALAEQIQPFTWLTTPNKYLVLMENGTHFSVIDSSPQSVFQPPDAIVGPEPATARRYLMGLSLAFLESYLNNQPNYRVYLQPAYIRSISREALSLSILRSLSSEELQRFLSSQPPVRQPAAPAQPTPATP